jgi:hypothetical protein
MVIAIHWSDLVKWNNVVDLQATSLALVLALGSVAVDI